MSDRSYDLTRRAFLKGSVAGGVVLSAGPLLTACASSGVKQPPIAPVRGGTLRVAVSTGRGTESLDPHLAFYNYVDQARIYNLYDGLVGLAADGRPRLDLAEELTPDKSATMWTVRLRQGITFHDGRPITADDAIFSIHRAAQLRSINAPSYEYIDVSGIRKADALTIMIPTLRPVAIVPQLLANASPVVPQDFDPNKPVGSGPFSVQAFQPGRESQFVRYPNYWNKPAYLDQLNITGIVDPAARLNALKAGQVDLVDAVPGVQARTLTGATKPLRSESAGFLGFAMNTKVGPFQDGRVRQALRLIVDRKRMIDQVFAGYGRVGNDIYASADPAGIDRSIPQWSQNIEQAKSLLRAAGQSNLDVELTTAPTRAGAIEEATVLAEQAKAAGVTIRVRQLDINAYVQGYGTYPIAVATLEQLGQSFVRVSTSTTTRTAKYNDTQFADAEFDNLISQAISELDSGKRADLIHAAQRILHDRGGYLIWGFPDYVDGANSKVGGFVPHHVLPMGGYDFKTLYLAK